MAAPSTPTVQALDESLRDLVHWERVAIHLPEMDQPTIDKIRHDYSGTDNQKQALYETWLRSYPHATWSNVIHALEAVGENSLAKSIRQIPGIRNRNTKKFAEKIDEGVVTELRRLHKTFDSLAEEVEKRCSQLVASNEISLDDVSRPFCRSKSVRISGMRNIQSVFNMFELLSDHYSFLDCGILEKVVEKLPQSNELLAKVQNHIDNVRNFKRETPIRCLKNKLQPFVRQAHLNEISLMVIFELEEAWEEMDLRLFETLLEALFPTICKEMTWYKVEMGSLILTFISLKDNENAFLSMIEQKQSFIKLVGVISLRINEKIALDSKETKLFSFESALLKTPLVGNHEALLFLLTVVGVDIDHQDETGQTALMIAVANNGAEIAQILLNAKADPNHQQKDGNTALHIACYAGYTQLAALLLESGASLNITNNKGDTPFLSSVRGNMMEVVMMIAPKLPKSEIPPAVLLACRLGYYDIISCLLQYIDPPSSRIHHYCANGDLALAAQHIVEFNEDIDSTLELGITPLMIASSCGHVEVVECLIEANASVKCIDQDGYSALAYAIVHVGTQSLAVVECLLQAQADPFITVGGDNLIQIAKENSDLTDLLLQYMALRLYSMFSSLVEKIQRDLANEVAVHKVTVQEIKSKLLSDPEFSHIEGIAKISSCSELFTCLKPHRDFLSWKVISFLSDCLKQEGYFKFVETFEANLETKKFPKIIALIPQLEGNVFSSTCSELTISLHRQWGIQSMSNLRRLNSLLFSSLARLMSHITVSVTRQETLVTYQIPKSKKLVEKIKSLSSQKQVLEKFGVLGVVEVFFSGQCVLRTDQSFLFQSAIPLAIVAHSMLSSEKIKLLKFLSGLSGTDPNSKSVEGNPALFFAAFDGYSSVVDFLLSIGAEPDAGNDDGYTPLMVASGNGHLDIVKSLVHGCPSAVNTAASDGRTPLMFATYNGKTDVVQFLLKNSSNPNMSTVNGTTAIVYASYRGFTEIAKLLLEAGADPNMLINDGGTALVAASSKGHSAIVRLLFSYHADHRHTILVQGIPCDSFAYACSNGNIETVQIFLDAGIVSDGSLSIGWYMACLYNQSHLIKHLIYSLPQVSSDNRELVAACVKGDLAHIKNVLHPDDVEFVHGVTPLMVACSCGHTGIVKALLDAGASVSRSDEFGYKAVDYCKKHSPILDILNKKEVIKCTFNAETFFSSVGGTSPDKGISSSLSTRFTDFFLTSS